MLNGVVLKLSYALVRFFALIRECMSQKMFPSTKSRNWNDASGFIVGRLSQSTAEILQYPETSPGNTVHSGDLAVKSYLSIYSPKLQSNHQFRKLDRLQTHTPATWKKIAWSSMAWEKLPIARPQTQVRQMTTIYSSDRRPRSYSMTTKSAQLQSVRDSQKGHRIHAGG